MEGHTNTISSADSSLLDLLDKNDDANIWDIFLVLAFIGVLDYNEKYFNKKPCRTSALSGHNYVLEVLNGHESRCYDMFRMDPPVFIALCEELKAKIKFKDSRYLTTVEQLAIFILIISYNERNCVVAERFQHSGATISVHFNSVLRNMCKLGTQIICPPNQCVIPPEIRHNPRYYKYFKNCIGAIDGTHIDARIPIANQIPYRGKKIETTQNVMCACSFNMGFTFVVTGWDGTANDSRVIFETISKPENEFPMPTGEKYYVVESGYLNLPGFLAPFRKERYHVCEFQLNGPPTKFEEMFNFKHASLRNVIDRYFGLLKARFPILMRMPPYLVPTQKYIPLECCTVHNFIRKYNQNDRMFQEYDVEDMTAGDVALSEGTTSENAVGVDMSPFQIRQIKRVRNRIAEQIWETEG